MKVLCFCRTAKQGLYLDTLDAQRLQKIRELETVEVKQEIEKEVVHQKPVFLTPLNNLDHLKEGEHAHLECRVEPINDSNLKIEWYPIMIHLYLHYALLIRGPISKSIEFDIPGQVRKRSRCKNWPSLPQNPRLRLRGS